MPVFMLLFCKIVDVMSLNVIKSNHPLTQPIHLGLGHRLRLPVLISFTKFNTLNQWFPTFSSPRTPFDMLNIFRDTHMHLSPTMVGAEDMLIFYARKWHAEFELTLK